MPARPSPRPSPVAVALLLGLLLGAAFPGFIAATRAAEPLPPQKQGIPVGQKAPEFTLPDQDGKQVALGALLAKGKVAVVFYRSAEW